MVLKEHKIKWIILAICFFISYNIHNSEADDLKSTDSKTASDTYLSNQLPSSLLNAVYFKNHNEINWNNIKDELIFKKNFFTGRRPEKPYTRCHKFQRRITRAIDRSLANKEIELKVVDNNFLFGENSSIERILSQPKSPSALCNFHSIGDLSKGCVLYCDYHGIDFESDFFKQHRKEIESSQPFLKSEDIAEIIIFSPYLLMLVIIWFMWPKKKHKSLATNH